MSIWKHHVDRCQPEGLCESGKRRQLCPAVPLPAPQPVQWREDVVALHQHDVGDAHVHADETQQRAAGVERLGDDHAVLQAARRATGLSVLVRAGPGPAAWPRPRRCRR